MREIPSDHQYTHYISPSGTSPDSGSYSPRNGNNIRSLPPTRLPIHRTNDLRQDSLDLPDSPTQQSYNPLSRTPNPVPKTHYPTTPKQLNRNFMSLMHIHRLHLNPPTSSPGIRRQSRSRNLHPLVDKHRHGNNGLPSPPIRPPTPTPGNPKYPHSHVNSKSPPSSWHTWKSGPASPSLLSSMQFSFSST